MAWPARAHAASLSASRTLVRRLSLNVRLSRVLDVKTIKQVESGRAYWCWDHLHPDYVILGRQLVLRGAALAASVGHRIEAAVHVTEGYAVGVAWSSASGAARE